jgi:hypothetical protein
MAKISVGSVLKALKLISATKVHFADQSGSVAVIRKMGGPGQMFGKNNPMVVPSTAMMSLLAG